MTNIEIQAKPSFCSTYRHAAAGQAPIRIIYTPNADRFKFKDWSIGSEKYACDLEVIGMRQAYAELRSVAPELPQTVGVVTYNDCFKYHVENMRSEMAMHGVKHPTTTYLQLDLIDAVYRVKNEDISNLLMLESCYRTLINLF